MITDVARIVGAFVAEYMGLSYREHDQGEGETCPCTEGEGVKHETFKRTAEMTSSINAAATSLPAVTTRRGTTR